MGWEEEEEFFLPFVRKVELVLLFCHLPLPPVPIPRSLLTALPSSVSLRSTPGQWPTPRNDPSVLKAAHLG